jgi:hypothetical protein
VVRAGQDDDEFLLFLSRPDYEADLKMLDDWFKRACDITSSTPSELIRATGFHPNDIAVGRISSCIAQVRALFALRGLGAAKVRLLRSAGNTEADCIAVFGTVAAATEVFYRARWLYLWSSHSETRYDMVEFFVSHAVEKKRQLEATAVRHQCPEKLLLLVVDSPTLVALRTKSDFQRTLASVAEKLGWDRSYHFGVITGMSSLSEGPDDCIYPSILNE